MAARRLLGQCMPFGWLWADVVGQQRLVLGLELRAWLRVLDKLPQLLEKLRVSILAVGRCDLDVEPLAALLVRPVSEILGLQNGECMR